MGRNQSGDLAACQRQPGTIGSYAAALHATTATRSAARPPAPASSPWASQLRRELGRLALEQPREVLTDVLFSGSMLGQDVACDTVALAQCEQQVLRVRTALTTDVLRLLQRGFEHTLRARRYPERSTITGMPAPDAALDRAPNAALINAKLGERAARKSRLSSEREQQMLGAEVAVAEPARVLERTRHDQPRRLVEVLRPGERGVDEALVCSLLCDPESGADLRPGVAIGACGLDIAIEERVPEGS